MIKKLVIVGGIIVLAIVITVVVLRPQNSGPAPDLDSAMIETAKHLHPTQLKP